MREEIRPLGWNEYLHYFSQTESKIDIVRIQV